MKYLGKIAACALALFILIGTAGCRSRGENGNTGSEPEENLTESFAENYDWSVLNTASSGTGDKREGKVPFSYLVPKEYYTTTDSDKTRDGVRRITYGIKLTELRDPEIMTNINGIVSDTVSSIANDVSWITEEDKAAILADYPEDHALLPVNYAAADVTVMGNVLSVTILYIHSYNVTDAGDSIVDDVSMREGRVLYNFDLASGKVVKLPELFDSDVNYISLLTKAMNQVGEEVGYEFRGKINGLPEGFDVYCFSGSGLVIGLPDGNPFVEGEKWFSLPLAELIGSMSLDPEETALYFTENVALDRVAFRVPGLVIKEEVFQEPFGGETVAFPFVAGIAAAEKINTDLRSWYTDITSRTFFTEEELEGGGTYSAEVEAPAQVICVTVFVYCASSGDYRTLSHVYDARSGNRLTVGDLLSDEAREKYPQTVKKAVNFRISSDFLIGIPEQTGVEEYLLIDPGEVRLSFFEN